MKRADSVLIRRFISNVNDKLITGVDKSTGPKVLQEIVDALQAIHKGANTDTALQITRTAGGPPDPYNFALAYWIYKQREAGEKWAVIELDGNKLLARYGRKEISRTRMQQIYNLHFKTIQDHEALKSLYRALEEFNVPKKE